MDFRTVVEIPQDDFYLDVNDRILLLGSCFAEHIGGHLVKNKFTCDVNPFGVLYNPTSIANSLSCLFFDDLSNTFFSDQVFKSRDDRWYSWMHDSKYSAPTKEECLAAINKRLNVAKSITVSTDYLFITFGTNRCYSLKPSGRVVSNCHKQPATAFDIVDNSVEDILFQYIPLLERLFVQQPQLRIVFTVSPYRYAKYGFHGNQLSKSVLLLAIDALVKHFPAHCFYFPAYELLLDELRDYRFFGEDMLHPSLQAVDYIWERFVGSKLTNRSKDFLKEWESIVRALNHRPFHSDSTGYREFVNKIILRIKQLKENYPNLAVQNEIEELKCRINKV